MTVQDHRKLGVVPLALSGERLDRVLAELFSHSGEKYGLRGVKRLWEAGRVLVDGRPRPKGFRVSAGAVLTFAAFESAQDSLELSDWPGLRVVAQKSGYMAAIFKPAGLNSEALAGRESPSVEAFLPSFWPGRSVRLVNRLDKPVTGIVSAALCEDAYTDYRRFEDAGEVEKTYLAVVRGAPPDSFVVDRALETAGRRKVKVLDEPAADPLRRSSVRLLSFLPDTDKAVVAVTIAKGARHQIRAHLASAACPIVGDATYGQGEDGPLHLHHCRISTPEFNAKAMPPDSWQGDDALWSQVQAFMARV
jgi:23S rRNA pseudouridine1911/1915/1917 synthase